jgi:type VI secretion system secreted protein Hcp
MAGSIFARIGTIKGESQDDKHRDEIEVSSWAWGVSQSGTLPESAGAGAGKASFQDFNFTHQVDRASPPLMKACATGEHLDDATITVRRVGSDQQEYLVVTMADIRVTSVSTSAGGDAAFEAVTLAFASVDLEYVPQKPDGSLDVGVHFTFDLKRNKEG